MRLHIRWLIFAAATALAIFLIIWSQPERQLRLRTGQLVSAVEGRKWAWLESLFADDYADPWGNDKPVALDRLHEVFRQFIIIDLEAVDVEAQTIDAEQGTVRTRFTLLGRGGPYAEMAIDRVKSLREPFTLTWRKRSWKPWDWVLIRVEQPELKVESW